MFIRGFKIKLLNPRSSDTNILGMEPTWQVQPTEYRITALSKAFTWYNYFYGKKDARDMIVNYLETHGRKADVRLLKGIPDSAIRLTTGWLCRMTMLGLELNDSEQARLQSQLREILDSKQNTVEEAPEEPVAPKITIQDRLREKANECDGELEGLFDEFLLSGAKMTADFKPVVIMRGLNIAPQMVSQISDNWKRKLSEFERVVEGKDAQLVEGYSHLSKIQMRNVIKFCEAVINDCGAYVQIKKQKGNTLEQQKMQKYKEDSISILKQLQESGSIVIAQDVNNPKEQSLHSKKGSVDSAAMKHGQ